MRLALAFVVFVPAVLAQAVPDTTAAERYAPLAVGSEWHYVRPLTRDGQWLDVEYRRRQVTDVLVRGAEYAVVVTDAASETVPSWFEVGRDTVRFDAGRAVLVRLSGNAEVVQSCPLDAAFGAVLSCETQPDSVLVAKEGGQRIVKTFSGVGQTAPFAAYVADVGLVEFQDSTAHSGGEPEGAFQLWYVRTSQNGEFVTQGHPVAPDDVYDPTPPHLYYPLYTGYTREDRAVDGAIPLFRDRVEIQGDTLIDGHRYAIEWSDTQVRFAESWGDGRIRFLRFDSTSTRVVERLPDGVERPVTPPFGARFGTLVDETGAPLPDGRAGEYVVFGDLNVRQKVAGQWLPIAARKSFLYVPYLSWADAGGGGLRFGAGIGELPMTDLGMCHSIGCSETITYLRLIDESGAVVEYGAPLPTTGEAGPRATLLAVGPNPTPGPFALLIDAPTREAVTAEVFDALGRRVWHRTVMLGASRQRVPVEATGWAAGLYVVRVRVGDDVTTARVVRL